ncbi:MAG: (Na+)-NQR maturation NqrM [Pseudomonadales bacterium]|jgi:hypothetical protein|nr:(Na+)-NQR maturation NqrM [Pseudomonadales bacterium]MDA0762154.1 (Na+)-NQR maturation NqrM [Pseudomonadota bacterium]MDA0958467.1 (Na+)-NQR maturation NqrM [Pseudomonadota bacterium]
MVEFLLTFFVFLAVVVIMAVGVLRGRPPISGSCGGLNALGVDGACEICGGNPNACENENQGPTSVKAPKIKNALEA